MSSEVCKVWKDNFIPFGLKYFRYGAVERRRVTRPEEHLAKEKESIYQTWHARDFSKVSKRSIFCITVLFTLPHDNVQFI